MDDALTPDERVELEALLASDHDHAARARAFEEVDAQLRSFAEESVDEDRLATTYNGLRARLAIDGLKQSDGVTSSRPHPDASEAREYSLGGPMIPILLAAAAVFIFYVVVPGAPSTPLSSAPESAFLAAAPVGELDGIDEELGSELDSYSDAFFEDELILVLGYGDEMSELQGITRDDLNIIERLELLDFLSDRELSDRERALGGFGGVGERGERG
jgi:hypothetical protein